MHVTRTRLFLAGGIAATAIATTITVSSALASPGDEDAYTKGLDVSHYEGRVDWPAVHRAGYRFMYTKASEGPHDTDPTLRRNLREAKAVGLYYGGFHFARPDEGSAVAQANHFADVLGYHRDGRELPPMADIEYAHSGGCYGLSHHAMVAWIKAFMKRLRERTGSPGLVYTSPGFWKECTGDTHEFAGLPLMIAHYNVSHPIVPGGWRRWEIWQHSEHGRVPGIGGNHTDLDRFNGGEAGLRQLAGE